MQGVLTGVADVFTTDGESACGGKLPNVVAVQKYFHGIRVLECKKVKMTMTIYISNILW